MPYYDQIIMSCYRKKPKAIIFIKAVNDITGILMYPNSVKNEVVQEPPIVQTPRLLVTGKYIS